MKQMFLQVILIAVVVIATATLTKNYIIRTIKVDGVDEVDKGVITLDIDGQLHDYEYTYTEIDRSFLEKDLTE